MRLEKYNWGCKMKRTQIMLEQQQYKTLAYLASHEHKSIGGLIREAIDKVYEKVEINNKSDIVKKMSRMNLPVSSWENMEEEDDRRLVE